MNSFNGAPHQAVPSNTIQLDSVRTRPHSALLFLFLERRRINKLSANPKNTEYMVNRHPWRINKVEVPEPLNLNDSEIKHVAKAKSLGVVVDDGLNRDYHFSKVKGKIRSLKN